MRDGAVVSTMVCMSCAEAMRDEIPGGMVRRQLRGGHAGARFDGRARSQAFDAVAVKRADAGKLVARLARHADVPELGVIHAEHRRAAHDGADADAGAHRDVGEVVEAHGRAPAPFGERRAVDVGVETHRHADAPAEPLRDIGVAPARLGGRGDESVGGRVRRAGRRDRTTRCRARARAPCCERQRSSTASIWRSVSSRSPVGSRSTARTSSGPVPRMHTHLVPPNSTPASSLVAGDTVSPPIARPRRPCARLASLAFACGEEAVVRGRGRGIRRDFLADGEHQALDLFEIHRVDQRIVVARYDARAFEDPEPVEIGEQLRAAAG